MAGGGGLGSRLGGGAWDHGWGGGAGIKAGIKAGGGLGSWLGRSQLLVPGPKHCYLMAELRHMMLGCLAV